MKIQKALLFWKLDKSFLKNTSVTQIARVRSISASVTKSILSALIGIAIEKGYIKSTEETVMGYFPEYTSISSNGVREKVTIQNLLTMTAPYSFNDWSEPLEAFCTSPTGLNLHYKKWDRMVK